MSRHWASELMERGIYWESGGKGPESYDCWSFVRFIWKEYFDISVPEIGVNANNILNVAKELRDNEERMKWNKVDSPKEGDAVLLAHAKFPTHIGVWIDEDGGGVLHCVKGAGVVFQSIASLENSGWGRIEYFERC